MNKKRSSRNVWLRPARRVQQYFEATTTQYPIPELPIGLWKRLEQIPHLREIAIAHDWLLATDRLKREYQSKLIQFHDAMTSVRYEIDRPHPRQITPTLRDLLADLEALADDFSDVKFESKSHVLSVTTEPITLLAVELGPFEIQLHCRDLQSGQSSPYRVIALEPNPSSTNDEVTHPQVQSESLCEGDGRQAIAAALAQGRIHDFFVIVANLLRTYNEGSPYVGLDDWFGTLCDDCGDLRSSDAIVSCGQCVGAICEDCIDRCAGCDENTCRGCLEACPGCDDYCCSGCLSTCVDCDTTCCPSCLTDSERCPDCHETQEESDEYEPFPTTEPPVPQTSVTVQSDRLGQAAVPA